MILDPWTFLLLAMATPGGLLLDFTQEIVNVQWEGGLAVEFFDGENGTGDGPA